MADFFNWVIRSNWYTRTIGTILRSVRQTVIACLVIAALMSSCLYYQSWATYYDTIRVITESRQQAFAQQFAVLYFDSGDPGKDLSQFETLAKAMVATMRGRVILSRTDSQGKVVLAERDWWLDPSRTFVESNHDLSQWNPLLAGVSASFAESNRPPFFTALGRASVWSIRDFWLSPSDWIKFRLYNRSIPLWTAFFILFLSLFIALTALGRATNAIYELELSQVRSQIGFLKHKLGKARDESLGTEDQIRGLSEDRDSLASECDSLRVEVKSQALEVERIRTQNSVEAASVLQRYEATRRALDEKESQLRNRDLELKLKEVELIAQRQQVNELNELLQASDEDFAKLESENRELKKLSAVAGRILRRFGNSPEKAEGFLAEVDRIGLARWGQVDGQIRSLERQLQRSIEGRSAGPAEHWSQHGTLSYVREQFNCMNNEFVRKFFARVSNGPYDSFHRRTIRVCRQGVDTGELVIVLNHDKGCAVNLGFRLKKKPEVHDVIHAGVVLAMLVRVVNKNFEDFEIRCVQSA